MSTQERIAKLLQSKKEFEQILTQKLSAEREIEIRRRIREIDDDIEKLKTEK